MNFLLAAWIAFISADRINVAGRAVPFVFTPFLALTPFVLLSEAVRRYRDKHRIMLPITAVAYAAVVGGLLSISIASVFWAPATATSASRTALLIAHVCCTLAVAVLVADREDLLEVMARGAMMSLALFALFDVAEAMWWIGRLPETLHIGPVLVKLGELQSDGLIPRLAGPVADGNRGGFVLLFYIATLVAAKPTWPRRVGVAALVLFLVATGSRSAALGALGLIVTLVVVRGMRPSKQLVLAGAFAMMLLSLMVLAKPRRLSDTILAAQNSSLAERVNFSEGTGGQSHLELLRRGVADGTSSVPRALFGLGYGNSFWVLQDLFPANRYGNYHSIYVTMFAETGVFALLLILVLIFLPLLRDGPAPWREVIAGAMLFNIFYQSTAEPVFWFVLASGWLSMRQFRAHWSAVSTAET